MTSLQIANVLQFASVASLWSFVLLKTLSTYRLDSFRQKMFCVRDELFDYAANGKVAFDDPAYVLLRQQMNAFIRYGHQLTVFRTLMTNAIKGVGGPRREESWGRIWEPTLSNVKSEEVRVDLRHFHERAMSVAIKHLISGSPLLWLGIVLVATFLLARGAAVGVRQLLKAAVSTILVGPLDQKLIEDEVYAAQAC